MKPNTTIKRYDLSLPEVRNWWTDVAQKGVTSYACDGIRGLQTASLLLNPLKMTIITMSEKREIMVNGNTIEVIPVVEWLMKN